MAEVSKIEWTDATWNPWIGCTKISDGCTNCYAETMMDKRMKVVKWGAGQPRVLTSDAYWKQPLRWDRQYEAFAAANNGRRRRVFCASLADVFDNEAPAGWRAVLFALICGTPHLDWLILTKRVGNVPKMLEAPGMPKAGLPPNVWLGSTVVNQEEADRDIPKLLAVPARVRFLSMEPLLGPVNLRDEWFWPQGAGGPYGLHWIIVGGESGPKARPLHTDWALDIRDQCAASGVPFLFKQWGTWGPARDADVINRGEGIGGRLTLNGRFEIVADYTMQRFGKKAAGRLLDGIEHNGYPETSNA